jgi:hypothetical protein
MPEIELIEPEALDPVIEILAGGDRCADRVRLVPTSRG